MKALSFIYGMKQKTHLENDIAIIMFGKVSGIILRMDILYRITPVDSQGYI